jgi:hypothetical protein
METSLDGLHTLQPHKTLGRSFLLSLRARFDRGKSGSLSSILLSSIEPQDRKEEEEEEEEKEEDERGRDDASVDDDEEKEEGQFARPTRFLFLASTLVLAIVL